MVKGARAHGLQRKVEDFRLALPVREEAKRGI